MVQRVVAFGKIVCLFFLVASCEEKKSRIDPRTAPFVFRQELSQFEDAQRTKSDFSESHSTQTKSKSLIYTSRFSSTMVWTLGPENHRVRRDKGPIQHLKSYLYGYERRRWDRGNRTPSFAYDLNQDHVIDAKDLVIYKNRIILSGMGSARLWSGRWNGKGFENVITKRTGLGPRNLRIVGDTLELEEELEHARSYWNAADLSFLSRVYPPSSRAEQRSPSSRAERSEVERSPAKLAMSRFIEAPTLSELGKILFYTEGLWKLPPGEGYTCNTCHPDGGTDHRIHPGFHESRWELTRPLWGIGQLRPLFTNMSAKTLGDAVEGLVRSLDLRFWVPEQGHEEFWLEEKAIQLPHGKIANLSPLLVRKALLAFLYSLKIERPKIDKNKEAIFAQGASLFQKECASCHQMRGEKQSWLFYAPLFAKTGIEPVFTEHGNRISPLIQLSRRGPFMSNGQFASLEELLRAFGRDKEFQHYKKGRIPMFSRSEIVTLSSFLREL